MDGEVTVLPAQGIISVRALAKYLDITDTSLIEGLNKQNIPYIKLSKFHSHWLIRLEDLKANKRGEKLDL